jgi:hypothetical protein
MLIWKCPSKEDAELEKELTHLFSQELGHTFIGAKPMSCEEWFWYRSVSRQSKEKTIDFLERTFADKKTFILHIHTAFQCMTDITLIHKPLLIKTICKEKYLKNFIKRQYGNTTNFFQKLENCKGCIFNMFHYDDRALGLAFGYGKTNSFYASRRMEIQHFFRYGKGFCGYIVRPMPSPWSIVRFCKLPLPWIELPQYDIRPSVGFYSLEEELDYLKSQEHKIQSFDPPYLFAPPCFIAKRCAETERLIKHYKKSTEKLAQIHLKKSFSKFLAEQNT